MGVLFVAVLHFLTDEDQPWEQVAAFRWRMASGSMLAVSHITSDGTPPDVQATIQDVYAEASAPAVFRTRQEIEAFFGGLDLVEPGLVEVGAWRSLRPSPPAPLRFLGGVARIISTLWAILSLPPASALLPSQRAGMVVTPYSVAAPQLSRTRRPADRGAVRPAACEAAGVGVGTYRPGRACRAAGLRTCDQRGESHGGTR